MNKKPVRIYMTLTGFFFLFFVVACAQHARFISPKVELLNLNVRDVTLSHINYQARVRLYNPNLQSLHVNFMEYSLFVNGINLVNGAEQVDEKIGPHEEAAIPVKLSGSVFNVIRLVSSMQKAKDVDFELKGTVSGTDTNGQTFSLPFAEKGKLDLSALYPGL